MKGVRLLACLVSFHACAALAEPPSAEPLNLTNAAAIKNAGDRRWAAPRARRKHGTRPGRPGGERLSSVDLE